MGGFTPWPEIFAVVRQVRDAGFRVGIISNHITAWFDDWFTTCKLGDIFNEPELVAVSARMCIAKPDPAIFTKYCEQNSLQPSECVFVDNTEENVEVARSLGWQGIHFEHRNKKGDIVEPVEALVDKLKGC